MSHLLTYEQIRKLTISELINLIDNSPKILVSKLKLIDLFDDNRSVTGVYLFYNEDNKPMYVGVLAPQIAGHNLKNKLGLIKFGNHDINTTKIYT